MWNDKRMYSIDELEDWSTQKSIDEGALDFRPWWEI